MIRFKNLRRFLFFGLVLFWTISSIESFALDYQKDGVTVISSDKNHISISYKPVLLGIDTIKTTSGEITLLPRIKGAKLKTTTPGSPSILEYKIQIAVPSEKGFYWKPEYHLKPRFQTHAKIAPFPELKKIDDVATQVYTVDNKAYDEFEFSRFTGYLDVKYAGIARDVHVAEINMVAGYYQPSSKETIVDDEFLVNIEFSQENFNLLAQPDLSDFDYSSFILNSRDCPLWKIQTPRKDDAGKKNIADQIASAGNPMWVKIAIDKEGVYTLNQSDLTGLGLTLTKEDISTIKIYGNGGDNLSELVLDGQNNQMHEQAIIVKTAPSGDLQNIIFYGAPAYGFKYANGNFTGFHNYYSNTNYYLLTWGGAPGKRAVPTVKTTQTVETRPATYREKILYFEEKNNAFLGGSGKIWFGGTIFPRNFVNMLYNLDRTGEVSYRIYLTHRSSAESGYGTFTVNEQKTEIGQINLGRTVDYLDAVGRIISAKLPASSIQSDNRSNISINYTNPSITTASPFFNWLEIQYPRSFVPINNEIGFFTDTTCKGVTEFNVNSFSGDIYGFDITDRSNPVQLQNEATTGGMFIFRDEIAKDSPKNYFISSSLKTPKLSLTEFGYYRNTKFDDQIIVITHPALLQSANKYKEYREKNFPVKVGVFRTDLIYNEFGSGIPDPTAIRDFISYAFHNWNVKPRYVLLWGDGHYDYKNIQSQAINYIPPYETVESPEAFYATSSYTCEDYFARVEGEDLKIDVTLGRMPIDNPAKGLQMLNKIINYEQNSSIDEWRTVYTLLADDSYVGKETGDGNTHTNQSETISRGYMIDDVQQKKIYLADYPVENIAKGRRKPRTTADLLSQINTSGTMLINWVGHGNPRVWAHEEILDRDKTIPQMKNSDKLFFCCAATCDYARFDMPDGRSGAEEFVLSTQGGAIGVFAADRVVYAGENSEINQEFITELFSRDKANGKYRSLGDIYYSVKQSRYSVNDAKYFLLGDPYLTLLMPNYTVQIDSINGKYVADKKDTVKLKALSKVRVSGRILNPGVTTVADDFNGTCILTMFDSDIQYDAIDDFDGTDHNITKFGGALNRSSATIKNGFFSTSFIIPEDISYQKNTGRLNGYAFTSDKKFAEGANRCFVLDGLDTSNIGTDTKGPDLEVYLDSLTFKNGDLVSKRPLLIVTMFDESGINATGNGIGHRIEAWFDNNPEPIDLTNKYTTNIADSRYGSAEQYIFDLAAGTHKVKVRAWDVFNNFSVAEANFRIAPDGEGIIITQMNNFPNPFDNNTIIRFEHNQSQLFNATINIFTPEGRLVRTLSEDLNSVHTSELIWDCLDMSGNRVSTGAYIFTLTMTTKDGQVARKQSVGALIR